MLKSLGNNCYNLPGDLDTTVSRVTIPFQAFKAMARPGSIKEYLKILGDIEKAIDKRNKTSKNRAVNVPIERVAHKMFTDDEKYHGRKRVLANSRMQFQVTPFF